MSAGSKQDRLHDLLEPMVSALGCELWGIEYSSGRGSTLRIFIDKDGGILLEDCERVSRQISSILDVEDPISTEYTLEVSSPGMDRPLFTLDHFSRFAGEMVNVRLKIPFEGRRRFKGLLAGVEGDEVVVQSEGQEYLFPIESIDKANVVPQFGPDTQEADK